MKLQLTLFSLLVSLAIPLSTQAAPTALSAASRISAVTVYADRAQVTRTCTLALKPGTNLVTFDALPLLMAEDSLRAEGTGTGRARIAGITVQTVFLERLKEKRIRELEDELQAVQRRIESIEARRKGLAAQRAFIESIRVGWGERISRELATGKPSTAELSEASRFVGEGVGKVEEGLYDTEAARKPLADRVTALQKELDQARGDRKKEVRSVEVAIEADRTMQFTLNLSYLVWQARWEPTYDVRLSADGSSAELTYRAQVSQRTGEAWPGVQLFLSSARPEAGGAPPELSPWYVSFYQPPRPMMKMARGELFGAAAPAPAPAAPAPAAPASDLEMAKGSAMPEESAAPIQAEIAEGQTSVLFKVAQPVDIPADGTRAGSVIAVEKVPVSAELATVPKLSPRVYLKSEVTNNTAYPLLAGEVNIFNDAVFTGKSRLKTIAAGEKFDLFFGADDQVKVKREVARVRKQAGILGSNRISYHVTVELENFKKHAVQLSLMDQLPLAGNEEIKVSLEEQQPKPSETKPDGTLVWKMNLAAGEKKKVSYDIVIEYPKGRDVVGVE